MDLQEKIQLSEKVVDKYINELGTVGAAAIGSVAGAVIGMGGVYFQCKKLYPDDKEKQKKCRKSPIWKRKGL